MTTWDPIVNKIVKLPVEAMPELDTFVDKLIIKHTQPSGMTATERHLNKLNSKTQPDNGDTQRLIESFRKEWDIVKEEQILTNHIIYAMREFRTPNTDTLSARRTNSDSRSGGFFEDYFGFLLKAYLMSKTDLWSDDLTQYQIDVIINESIHVPGYPRKRHPDILIRDKNTEHPICILELKSGFSKGSLKHTYNKAYNIWKKLGDDVKFMFVIFNCSSIKKSKVYKLAGVNEDGTNDSVYTMCCKFKTDQQSMINRVQPETIDQIEEIFEKIYDSIQQNASFKKSGLAGI